MNARKVLEMGGGTLLISLPKDWARKNGIAKGATVAVDEISPRKLMVRPIEDSVHKPKEMLVEYPSEELLEVANEVTGAYLLGYETIRIQGDRVISREDRERLKGTIARLIGLEIMDEDSKHVTLQFLLEEDSVDPGRIARRMSGIIEGMFKDTGEGVEKGDSRLLSLVGERDDEVDRLYFLLVRTIRTATVRPEWAERYGLSPVDILDYRVLASYMESVGDAVSEASKRLQSLRLQKGTARQVANCFSALYEMEDAAIKLFLSRRGGRSKGLHARVRERADLLGEKLGALALQAEAKGAPFVEAIGTIERMSRLLVDISDLTVPTHELP